MKTIQPNYQNCSVNLSNSILKHYGLSTGHPTLKAVDQALEKNYKNVILLVFDGLGSNLLQQHLSADSFLRQHQAENITSVFPPTTTAATTSLLTGMTPAEHGWLGWDLYFESVDQVVTTFLNTIKGTPAEQAVANHLAQTELPLRTIIDRVNQSGHAKGYWISPFENDAIAGAVESDSKKFINLVNYDLNNLDLLFEKLTTLCAKDERKFIYAYSIEPDNLMHNIGTKAEKVTVLINYLDQKTAELNEQLEDTLLIVTADHGHITAGEYLFLNEYPEIQNMLMRSTSIEPRCVNFFVKAGMHAEFDRAFKKHFGERFSLYTKQEEKDGQFFGSGMPHEKFESFLGDYLAVAVSDKNIMDHRVANPLKGIHAGILEDEVIVPVIIIEKSKGRGMESFKR